MKKETMKKRGTKTAFLTSLLSLLLCVTMLIGTTVAWFTDSVTSGRNQIIAGNLDVELYHSKDAVVAKTAANKVEGATNLFTDASGNSIQWEPGVVAYENFTVANVGDVAFKYDMALREWAYNTIDNGEHDLRDVIKVAVVPGGFTSTGVAATDRAAARGYFTPDTTFGSVLKTDKLYPVGTTVPADAPSEYTFGVVLYWDPTDNDNIYNVNNGRTVDTKAPNGANRLYLELGIDLVASQLEHEADSFDNTYDADATLAPLPEHVTGYGEKKSSRSANNINTGAVDEDVTIQIKNSSSVVGNAEITKGSADKLLDTAFSAQTLEEAKQAAKEENPDKDILIEDNLTLTMNMTTLETTTTSIKLDVSMNMEASRTTMVENEVTDVTNIESTPVTELADPVIVRANIGSGKEEVKITHSHEGTTPYDMEPATSEAALLNGQFYYNKETGELIIKTNLFSEFDITYKLHEVCRIGSVGYASLAEALAAVNEGETITLLESINEAAVIEKKITIDGNGNTLTAENDAITVKANGVTLKNVAAVSDKGIALVVNDDVTGVTVNGGSYKNTLTGKQGEGAIRFMGGNGDISVTGASLLGGLHVLNYASGSLTITGNTFDVDDANNNAGIVCGILIYGENAKDQVTNGDGYLSGNTFKKSDACNVLIQDDKWDTYYSEKTVAKIGDLCYLDLNAAIKAVTDGGTIDLQKDIPDTDTFKVGKKLKINTNENSLTESQLEITAKKLSVKTTEGVIEVYGNGYVAMIGNKGYMSFDSAMADVNANGITVEVVDNCSTSQNFNLSYNNFILSIDEDCTLTHNAYNGLFNLQPAAKNITLEGKGKLKLNGGIAVYELNPGANAALKNITIIGTGTAVFSSSGSTNSFTDVNIGVSLIDGIYYANKVYSGYYKEDVSAYLVDSKKGCTKLVTTDANGCNFFVDDLSEVNATLKIERTGQDPLYTNNVPASISGSCTVTVLKNILNAQTTITGSDVVFDLNGKTWTQNAPETAVSGGESNSYGILLTNCSNVTIKNGTFTATEQDNKHAIRVDASSVGVKLENLTVSFADIYYGNPIAFGGTGSDVTVTNCTFSAGTGVPVFKNLYAGCLTVVSGTFNDGECYRYLANDKVLIASAANVFTVADAAPETYTANINSKLYYTYTGGADAAVTLAKSDDKITLYESATEAKTLAKDETLTVVYENSATWGKLNPAEGYELVENTTDNTTVYTVKKINYFSVNSNYYASVSELNSLNSASISKQTVTLIRDLTTSTSITNSSSYTFNLNQKTLTYTGTSFAQTFNSNSGSRQVYNGTINAPNGSGLKKQYKNSNTTTYNLTINCKNTALDLYGDTINVTGGVYTAGTTAVSISYANNTTTTISGGTFTAATAIYNNNASTKISGGTFNGTCSLGAAKVTGGTFNGTLSASGQNISGGKFTSDPTAYLADGYTATLTEGYYVVSKVS